MTSQLLTPFKNSPAVGAILLGLIWAVAWAPLAVVVGVTIIDPDDSLDEMWFAAGAYPGFLCGVIFRALLGIARASRKIQVLRLSQVAAVGAVAGLVVGMLPFILADATTEDSFLGKGLVILAAVVGLSTISAVITAAAYPASIYQKLK